MTNQSERHSGEAWTDADDELLEQLAKENTPTRVIGLKLGRTEDAVYGRAKKLGISLQPANQSPYGKVS